MHIEVPKGKQINGFTGEIEDAPVVALELSALEQRRLAAGDIQLSDVKSADEYLNLEQRPVELGESFSGQLKDEPNKTKTETVKKEEESAEAVRNTERTRTSKK